MISPNLEMNPTFAGITLMSNRLLLSLWSKQPIYSMNSLIFNINAVQMSQIVATLSVAWFLWKTAYIVLKFENAINLYQQPLTKVLSLYSIWCNTYYVIYQTYKVCNIWIKQMFLEKFNTRLLMSLSTNSHCTSFNLPFIDKEKW